MSRTYLGSRVSSRRRLFMQPPPHPYYLIYPQLWMLRQTFLCVYVWAPLYAGADMCSGSHAHMCTCVWRPEDHVRCCSVFRHFPPLFLLRQGRCLSPTFAGRPVSLLRYLSLSPQNWDSMHYQTWLSPCVSFCLSVCVRYRSFLIKLLH